jgi:phospholipid-transporting ATPase
MTDESNPNHEQVMICLFFLATCHTIATDIKDGELIYNASSPDELALVNFARFCGVEYLGLDENNIITVKYKEKKFEFQ